MKVLPLLHTVPIVLVGVKRSDCKDKRANYTTIGDVAIAGLKPALMMISVHEDHFTTRCIKSQGVLSINIPSRDMLKKVDYCGRVSGFEVDKSKLFLSKWIDEVPYLNDTPIQMICAVEKSVQIEQRVIFILRVKKTMKAIR